MAVADEIIIYGFKKYGSDHEKTVRQIMENAKCVGMQFNPAKCQFQKDKVKFFSLMLTRQSVVTDPAKIDVLKKLPEPKTEYLLQSFLGIVNYLSRFNLQIANLTHNLRALLKKGNEFIWTDIHSKDFKHITDILCKEGKLLRYYRPDLDLYLEMDASGVAIGMALIQNDSNEKDSLYPIAYRSKTLTSAETRHANIKRELLGVVEALEKFHYFNFGRPVMVLTDHKPLISI